MERSLIPQASAASTKFGNPFALLVIFAPNQVLARTRAGC